jgi:hypothetical protein
MLRAWLPDRLDPLGLSSETLGVYCIYCILLNTDTVKRLYFAFVRSKLEYASVVWSTGYKSQIEDLEKIQRRLLKYLSFKVDGTYPSTT